MTIGDTSNEKGWTCPVGMNYALSENTSEEWCNQTLNMVRVTEKYILKTNNFFFVLKKMNNKQIKWLIGGGASLIVISIIVAVIVVNVNSPLVVLQTQQSQ